MKAESIFIAVAIFTLLALVLLRVVTPRAYDQYVLRDRTRPAPSRSSRVVASVILAVMVFLAVRFGMDLLRSTARQQLAHAPIIPNGSAGHMGAWVGLVCVSVTGIILSLFPVQVVARLIRRRVILSPADEEATKKIRIFGRLLGALFLMGAVLIGRHLL